MHLECYTCRKCLPWYVDLFFPQHLWRRCYFYWHQKGSVASRGTLYLPIIFCPLPLHLSNFNVHFTSKTCASSFKLLGTFSSEIPKRSCSRLDFLPPYSKFSQPWYFFAILNGIQCHGKVLQWHLSRQTVLDRIHASETSVQSCARWHVCVCRGLLLGWDRLWSGVDQSSLEHWCLMCCNGTVDASLWCNHKNNKQLLQEGSICSSIHAFNYCFVSLLSKWLCILGVFVLK